MREFLEPFLPFVPALVAALVGVGATMLLRRALFGDGGRRGSGRLGRQILLSLVALASALVVALLLPIEDATRGQLLSFFGIIISAAIALSSTSFIGNAMAGIMLKLARDFGTGDFVTVSGHFGRVIERGLLHTEIQNEERDRVIFPNLQLITNPVTVVHRDGTIVSATVSLGYDAPRQRVEELLLVAASRSGLADPFVQIRELGDFSIVYRVAGLLSEPKRMLSARSDLRCQMLDTLHSGGVEIVSPNFMNQRVLDPSLRFVPHVPERVLHRGEAQRAAAEDLVFDKAEEAESLENLEQLQARNRESLESARKSLENATENARPALESRVQVLETRGQTLARLIERRRAESPGSDQGR